MEITTKEQLKEFLMSDEGFIPIEDAIKEAEILKDLTLIKQKF